MVNRADYSGIFETIEGLRKQIEELMPSVRESIDDIINNNITSSIIIERLLDQLLDYTSLGLGERDFKRLNQHYTIINQENAAFYEREFNILREDD